MLNLSHIVSILQSHLPVQSSQLLPFIVNQLQLREQLCYGSINRYDLTLSSSYPNQSESHQLKQFEFRNIPILKLDSSEQWSDSSLQGHKGHNNSYSCRNIHNDRDINNSSFCLNTPIQSNCVSNENIRNNQQQYCSILTPLPLETYFHISKPQVKSISTQTQKQFQYGDNNGYNNALPYNDNHTHNRVYNPPNSSLDKLITTLTMPLIRSIKLLARLSDMYAQKLHCLESAVYDHSTDWVKKPVTCSSSLNLQGINEKQTNISKNINNSQKQYFPTCLSTLKQDRVVTVFNIKNKDKCNQQNIQTNTLKLDDKSKQLYKRSNHYLQKHVHQFTRFARVDLLNGILSAIKGQFMLSQVCGKGKQPYSKPSDYILEQYSDQISRLWAAIQWDCYHMRLDVSRLWKNGEVRNILRRDNQAGNGKTLPINATRKQLK